METTVVDVTGLSRTYGDRKALDGVSFRANPGQVYGLVGSNGAGKTTLLKHLLGLLRATAGTVRVFGLDPVRDPVGVLGRIGYLSEERDLPEWMSIEELMRYTQAYHPTWDAGYARELLETFALDPRGIVQLGLVLLIATPVARVALTLGAFLLQRDRLYVLLTTVVLVLLLFGLFS